MTVDEFINKWFIKFSTIALEGELFKMFIKDLNSVATNKKEKNKLLDLLGEKYEKEVGKK